MPDIQIVSFPATPVAAVEHRGEQESIGDSIAKLIAWRREHGLSPAVSATFNIVHSPDRYDLCVATGVAAGVNVYGVVSKTIPSGRCAVLRHLGGEETLVDSIDRLHRWLPESGETRRDYPMFMQRVAFFPQVAEADAITDIFLPIE